MIISEKFFENIIWCIVCTIILLLICTITFDFFEIPYHHKNMQIRQWYECYWSMPMNTIRKCLLAMLLLMLVILVLILLLLSLNRDYAYTIDNLCIINMSLCCIVTLFLYFPFDKQWHVTCTYCNVYLFIDYHKPWHKGGSR